MRHPLLRFGRARVVAEIFLMRYGAWPVLCTGVVLAALLFFTTFIGPLRSETNRHRSELEIASPISSAAFESTDEPAAPTTQADLRAVLPPPSTVHTALDAFFTFARQHQLRVTQSEYLASHERDASYQTLRANLGLSGPYPSIRRWVEDVLRAFPYVSLDQIGFERVGAADHQVVARVKLTLWLAPQTTGTAAATVTAVSEELR